MKTYNLFIGLLSLMAAACTVEEPFSPELEEIATGKGNILHAVIDDDGPSTKTYFDSGLNVLWNKNDSITVFDKVTYGVKYVFKGEEGDPGGDFEEIKSPGLHGGVSLNDNSIFAIYPHSKDTKIVQDGTITYTFPNVQIYHVNSFGPGANVMVAKTTDDMLRFKNAMGYLSFRLWGNDVHVSSIILEALGGEAISGKGTIHISENVPVVNMNKTSSSDERIRLFCDDVLLGTSKENYTEFWFALPPVSFTKAKGGFKITVTTTDGGVFTKTAPIDLTIKRKTVEWMAPLEVVPSYNNNVLQQIKLNSVSSTRNGHTYTADKNDSGDTFTLTIPTVTDFSQLVLDFNMSYGDSLMANGRKVISGVTKVDASAPLSLVICKGAVEKSFNLTARNTGLPVVRITTEGFTLAQLELYKNALQKVNGVDGTDYRIWLPEDKKTGLMRLPNNDGSISTEQIVGSVTVQIEWPDGSPGIVGKNGPVYQAETQIKGRGNYTWTWDKKPYALKLKDKATILDMPEHDRWILLANWRDRTLLRNDAGFYLSRAAAPEIPYTVRGQFVELEFNGEHRGNYYLCEQIKIDKNRVNIDKLKDDFTDYSGGFLMEIDSYWDELNKFHSKYFNLNYMFKEPDDDPNDPETNPAYAQGYSWMENRVNELEKVLRTRSSYTRTSDEEPKLYENYLDVNSAILFMLINELTGNRDYFQGPPHSGPHSTYLYKDKGENERIFLGPIWDLDYETFISQSNINKNSENGWRGFTRTGYYYHYLCYDQDFVDRIKSLWSSKLEAFESLTGYIDQMAAKLSLSQKFDEKLWSWKNLPYNSNRRDNYDSSLTFEEAITTMKENFNARIDWMTLRILGKENTQYKGLTCTEPGFSTDIDVPGFLFETPDDWPD